jgi:hypothetical protein
MKIKNRVTFLLAAASLLAFSAAAQQVPSPRQQQSSGDMPGMDMGSMRHDADKNPEAARSANDAMSGEDMDMNPHMFMTELRPAKPGDEKRAQEILSALRPAIEKYKDYRVALADGYKIFFPNVPQHHYHFTNYRYAAEATFEFNPAHPTSLLYKKTGDGYELEGAMYTAPKKATLDELDERVPLSVARWHKHVNFCMPPKGASRQEVSWKEFGLGGSITTPEACEQAGGQWRAQIFSWMVHVYPYETDPSKIWAH